MILQREIDKIIKRGEEASSKWIEPTLDLAETLDTTDPRELINLMLCGQDALLDGSFQREMIATLREDQAKAVSLRQEEKAVKAAEERAAAEPPTKIVTWTGKVAGS